MTVISNIPVGVPNSRAGVSPIGTTSPNSGSTAATNSTYGQDAFTSGISPQGTGTAYTVQNTDYQGIIIFNTSSAIAVTLNQNVQTNFTATILNLGTGAITLTPNGSLTVNGASSLTLQAGVGCQVFFANRAWLVYSGATSFPTVPVNTPAVSHEWLNSYNATTGAFTQTQPAYSDISGVPTLPSNTPAVTHEFVTAYNSTTGAFAQSQPTFSDISGNLATSQLPIAGISATITTAALTTLGTQGSMVFTNGILTAQVQAT